MESSFSLQLEYTIETLMSPIGAISAIAWVFLLIALIFSPKAKWLALIAMLWFAAFSFYVEEHVAVPLATPLNQIRAHGRLLSTALLISLVVPAFLAVRGWHKHSLERLWSCSSFLN